MAVRPALESDHMQTGFAQFAATTPPAKPVNDDGTIPSRADY